MKFVQDRYPVTGVRFGVRIDIVILSTKSSDTQPVARAYICAQVSPESSLGNQEHAPFAPPEGLRHSFHPPGPSPPKCNIVVGPEAGQ